MAQLLAVIVGTFAPIVGAGASVPTTAAEQYGQKIASCTGKSDMDGQQCLADLLTPIEHQLTRTFENALRVATAQDRASELRQAQTEWSEFVDAQCAFELAQFRGGTGYWSVGYICRIQRTAARIDDLSRVAGH